MSIQFLKNWNEILFSEALNYEAQLVQRYRAMLHAIEYSAESLKVIRNDTPDQACVPV